MSMALESLDPDVRAATMCGNMARLLGLNE